jgi:hypothetical protein
MVISKYGIVDRLTSRGDYPKAIQAERLLPDLVDTDRDEALLRRLGIDPVALLTGLGGMGTPDDVH